jgi:hypothetical protein
VEKTTSERWLGNSKLTFEVLREVLVLGFLIAVIGCPEDVREYAKRLGINKVPTPLGDVELAETRALATSLSASVQETADAAQTLKEASATVPASVRPRLESAAVRLRETSRQLAVGDSTVKETILKLSREQPELAAKSGWLFAGHVDESRASWTRGQPQNIAPAGPRFRRGDDVTVTRATYLRAESDNPRHNVAPVMGVLPEGARVEVDSVDYSHALRGGWFVWLKVRRE